MLPTSSETAFFLTILCVLVERSVSFQPHAQGERMVEYTTCLTRCENEECTGKKGQEFIQNQAFHRWLLRWSCYNECQQSCIWETVKLFQDAGREIPQFDGKWPLIRPFGIQEPASVLGSLLHLISVILGLRLFLKMVPPNAPMYNVWISYGMLGINTWIWSAVFHCRDVKFTEKMDYFCALSYLMSSVMCFGFRLTKRSSPQWKRWLIPVPFIVFYIDHCSYMLVQFDHSYHLLVSVIVASLSGVCWISWSIIRWKSRRYVRKCILVMILTGATSGILLICDTPPKYTWIFDAHSLWHLATVPLDFIWLSFAADDSVYIYRAREKRKSYGQCHVEDSMKTVMNGNGICRTYSDSNSVYVSISRLSKGDKG